jgi:hypothetical protein
LHIVLKVERLRENYLKGPELNLSHKLHVHYKYIA